MNAFIDRHASAEAGTWIYLWSQQNTETAMNIATAWHRLNKKKWRCWFFVIFLYAALFICSDFGLNTTKAAKKCDPFHTYLLVKISILCSFLSGFLSICLNKKKSAQNVWWISAYFIWMVKRMHILIKQQHLMWK